MSMSQGQSVGDALGGRAIDVVVPKPSDFSANMSGMVNTEPTVAMNPGQPFAQAVGNSGDVHSRDSSPLLSALCMAKLLPSSGFTVIRGTMSADEDINQKIGLATSELKQAESAISAAVLPSAPNIDAQETAMAQKELTEARMAREAVSKAVLKTPKM